MRDQPRIIDVRELGENWISLRKEVMNEGYKLQIERTGEGWRSYEVVRVLKAKENGRSGNQ